MGKFVPLHDQTEDSPDSLGPHGSLNLAADMLRRGQLADARHALDRVPECSRPDKAPQLHFACQLLRARLNLDEGNRERGMVLLGNALSYGKQAGLLGEVLGEARDILSGLCAEALEAEIEAEYVERLIGRMNLMPVSPTCVRWPYSIRIYTLGRTAVVVEGSPISFSGKAQRRPLELLYYLASSGGREIAVSRLISTLWADEDHEATRSAFDMALNRLRRLLAVDEVLPLTGGRLSLSDRLCWIDVRAFDRLLGEAEMASDPLHKLAFMERALDLYHGDFLSGEDAAWIVLARERLRARLLRSIKQTGMCLEEAGNTTDAIHLYNRVREIFPTEEDLCRRLISSHIKQQEYAQATSHYHRCRNLFSKVLGVLPSPATTALLEQIPANPPSDALQ